MTGLEQWSEHMMNSYGVPRVELVKGRGAILEDTHGHTYIDLLAGIAVNSLGHAHPELVDAVTSQLQTLGHTSNLYATQPGIKLAAELKRRAFPTDEHVQVRDSSRVFFCNSGAEANEAALKIARLTGKPRMIVAYHGFHGRTIGSLSLTAQLDKQRPFQPLPGEVSHFRYGDADSLRQVIEEAPERTAAVMLEPIQGETGIVPAPAGFLREVRALCDEFGLLMIVDEVQSGIGRTGDFFAFQADGVIPDVITMAKGLGGGLPIGACLATDWAAQLFTPGSHGTTFGGNPVVCAAALTVCATIDQVFLDQVRAKGEIIQRVLSDTPGVAEVRGRGLMRGVVLTQPVAADVVQRGYEHGILVNACGSHIIRLTPPLIIEPEQLERGCQALRLAIEEACEKQSNANTQGKKG